MTLVQAGDSEANARANRRQLVRAPDHLGQVSHDLLGSRAGQDRHKLAGTSPLIGQEPVIERPVFQLIEVRMTYVDRVRDAARVVPRRLEGEAAQHEIDEFLYFLDAPARPRPDLGRDEIDDRDAPRLGAPGDPPVQPRVVDQHDGVGAIVTKMAIGHEDQADERQQVEQHVQEPHHRQVDERVEQACPGRRHLGSAEPGELGVGEQLAKRTNQIGGMKIAAGLTGRNEDSHARNRFLANRLQFRPSVGRGTD